MVKERTPAGHVPAHSRVEADHAGKPEVLRAADEREGPSHAETDSEYSAVRSGAGAHVSQRGRDISKKRIQLELLYVWHEVEGVIARGEAGSAAKIVNSYRAYAYLGKTQRQFFIELVQPAHIGEDKYLCPRGTARLGGIGSKTIPVRCGEHDILSLGRSTCSRGNWRASVVIITHSSCLLYHVYKTSSLLPF
jgi:hypothetical protein